MAITGDTFAAYRAAGAAARNANTRVIRALSAGNPHLPESLAAISSCSLTASCTRNSSGESWLNAASRIPFADSLPSSIPIGIPNAHNKSTSAATMPYNCLFCAPIARRMPYRPIRLVTAIFNIL